MVSTFLSISNRLVVRLNYNNVSDLSRKFELDKLNSFARKIINIVIVYTLDIELISGMF